MTSVVDDEILLNKIIKLFPEDDTREPLLNMVIQNLISVYLNENSCSHHVHKHALELMCEIQDTISRTVEYVETYEEEGHSHEQH